MSKRFFCVIAALIAVVLSLSLSERLARLEPIVHETRVQNVTVEQVLIHGNRRIPESTVKIWIGTREGDPYNPGQLDRDVRALYAQGNFEVVKGYAEGAWRGER